MRLSAVCRTDIKLLLRFRRKMQAALLVFSVLLSSALSSPLSDHPLKGNERATTEEAVVPGANGYPLISSDASELPASTARPEESKDLTAQESFYPVGGIWWGVRPWGGWGGWGGGWGGYRPWHVPHWGGQWGGRWGAGRWGGGRWGRSQSR